MFMSETTPKEVSCQNCVGACCQGGIGMRLSHEELRFMEDGGSSLTVEVAARSNTDGIYFLNGDCRYLTAPTLEDARRDCSVHDNPRRPRVCGNFEVGSRACILARAAHGIETTPAKQF